jgi:hypothetical protein
MVRYSARTFLPALVVAAALPRAGFAQCVDQSLIAADTTSSPCRTFQEREIAPEQALRFVVGDWVGVAYFTSEPGGLRLVATIATLKDTESTPVRFVTTLGPNQIATVSVPRKVGEEAIELSFLRRGDRLLVKAPNTSN